MKLASLFYLDYKQQLRMMVRIHDKEKKEFTVHRISFYLENKVQMTTPSVNVTQSSGKIDVKLEKANQPPSTAPVMWKTIGFPIKQNPSKQHNDFRKWLLKSKTAVNHNVMHYVLQPSMEVSLDQERTSRGIIVFRNIYNHYLLY